MMKKKSAQNEDLQSAAGKKCFVIMPFGKEKAMQDTYMAIYRSIIRPAGEEAGYNMSRMDTEVSKVGSITGNIVRSLAEADLVIADLTDANANVLYELGIRHALKKCATVMIIQEGEPIPFDLSDYGVTFYSRALERMERSIKLIFEAIKKSERAQSEDQCDNPVFANYPSIEFKGEASNDSEILDRIDELTVDNNKLRELLEKSGVSVEDYLNKEDKLLALLEVADKAIEDSGPEKMLELQKAVARGDTAVFISGLKKVLLNEFLTERKFIELSRLCDNLGLIPHRIVVLTEAYSRFPNSYQIIGLLADAYSDHPDIKQKEKGREFIERVMHVKRLSHNHPTVDRDTIIEDDLLMGLFNIYIGMGDWDAIISFSNSTKDLNTNGNDAMIMRNVARAYVEKREFSQAQLALQEAIDADPENDALRTMLSELYKKMGDYPKAVEAQEQAVFLDPDDMTNFLNLSVDILNHGVYRNEDGELTSHGRKERTEEAISIYKYILDQDSSSTTRSRIVEFLTRRGRTKEAEEVLSLGTIQDVKTSYELEYIHKRTNVS